MSGELRTGGTTRHEGRYRARYGPSGLFSLRLLAGLLVAVALPWIAYISLSPESWWVSEQNALIGTGAALVLGYYIFNSFINFPGVQGGRYIVPSFIASYGLVLTLFFFWRFDYSRFQFLTSFSIASLWYSAEFFLARRRRRSVLGIVPGGKVDRLRAIDLVDWRMLDVGARLPRACDGIVVDLHAELSGDWERFVADCAIAGVPVFHYKQVQESLTGTVQIEHLSENNFGSLVPGFAYLRAKLVIDVAAAILVGAVLLLPLALLAVAIRLDSPGPALFRQRRMGFRGETFTVHKFRTMRHGGGDAADPRQHAMTGADDLRVTRLGRHLRHFRIDELPQIINILRGEMSWIGPRPEAEVLSRWYERELPFYRYRHIVRPGITGWAQVNQGHVAEVEDVLWKLHYDFYYIKYFSPWLDLLIVLRTIRTMLTGFGSR